MRLSAIKKHRKKHNAFTSLFLNNPVLVTGLALPFIIAASVSIRGGLAMSLQLLIIHTITVTVMFFLRKFSFWQKILFSAAISTVATLLAREVIRVVFPGMSVVLGMYLYLIAVNGMTLTQASTISRRANLSRVVFQAVLDVCGFAYATVIMALIREVLGAGTIMGNLLAFMPFTMEGLMLPFGGFMVLAFLLAGAKFFNKRLLDFSLKRLSQKESERKKIRIISEEEIEIKET